jgi:hypothetical protein
MRSRLAPPGNRTLRAAMRPRPIGRILLTSTLLLGLAGLAVVDVTAATPATRPTAGRPASRSAPTTEAARSVTPASWGLRRDLDLTAAALAGRAARQVRDHAFRTTASRALRAGTATTATASSTCRSCTAQATTLHVLYLPRARQVAVDNVASAWSRCRGCQATALSVQVVLAGAPQVKLTARNRALALHGSCARCHTASAAFQVVVSDVSDPQSPAGLERLRRWFREQAATLRSRAPGPAALRRLVGIVQDGAPGVVVRRTVSLGGR